MKADNRDLSKPLTEAVYTVQADEDGLRLDQFLAGRLFWRSRHQVQQLCAEPGRVTLRPGEPGQKLRKSVRLRVGQQVAGLPVEWTDEQDGWQGGVLRCDP